MGSAAVSEGLTMVADDTLDDAWAASEGQLSDEELAVLALAADPDAELDPDAVSVWEVIDGPACDGVGLLPGWYMPAAAANAEGRRRWWKRPVAVLIIASFLLVDALGLCITYGQLVVA